MWVTIARWHRERTSEPCGFVHGKEGELKEGKVGVDSLMLLGLEYLTIVQVGVSVVVI